MAFEQISSVFGAVEIAPPADVTTYLLDAAVAGVVGRVYEFNADGELVLSTDANVDSAVIALQAGDADTRIRCAWVAPGAIYRVPITDGDGTALTALAATLVVGARAQINDTADGMDGENIHAAGNPLTIVRIDGTNEIAWVAFNTCVLSLNI